MKVVLVVGATQKETQLLNVDHIAPKWMEWICGEMRFSARQLNYSTHNVQIYVYLQGQLNENVGISGVKSGVTGQGGGGTAPSRWIANCQPKRTLCVLEVIRKYPDSKKKNSMSIKSCIYIVRKELSIFACVCVCVCDKFIRLPQKKKKRKRTCSIHYRIDLCYTTNPSAHMRPSLVFPKRSGELKVCAISSVYRG